MSSGTLRWSRSVGETAPVPDHAPSRPTWGAALTLGSTVATALLLVLGVALAGAGPLPGSKGWLLAVVALLVVAGIAWGWPTLLTLPSPRGSSGVIAATGLVAVVVVATTPGGASLERLPVVLGLAVLAACVQQLLRYDGRPRVVDALGGTLMGTGLATCAAAWTTLPSIEGGPAVALGAAVVAVLVALLQAPMGWVWRGAGLVAILGVAVVVDALRSGVADGWGLGNGAGLGSTLLVVVLAFVAAAGVRALLGQGAAAWRTRTRLAMLGAWFALVGVGAHLVALL